jgi:hypothetical protein
MRQLGGENARTCRDPGSGVADQLTDNGARLLAYQRARGGTWHIARTWKGGRWEERVIKDWRNGPLLCPDHSPADRIAAALAYVTGPYREHSRHTQAAAQEMAAFTATVTAGIETQRATERAQAAPATQPQEETEVSTDRGRNAPPACHAVDEGRTDRP